MTIDTRQVVGDAIDDLAEGLRPFIERVFADRLPSGPSWVQVMAHKDELSGRAVSHHHANDVALMLRAMTEKLGNLGYPFDGHLSRQASNWASEMREVRNKHAHQVEFTPAETYRALDSAELLLREVGAIDEAQRIAAHKPAVLAMLGGGAGSTRTLPPPPAAPLPSAPVSLPAPPAISLPSLSTDVSLPVSPAEGTTQSETHSLSRRRLRERPDVDAPLNAVPKARLSLDAVSELSYAMAHARIVPVQEVRVAYDGPELRGASFEIEASTAQGSLGAPKVVILDLAPGTKTLTGLDLLSLDPEPMLRVDVEQAGAIALTLRAPDGAVIAEHRHPVTVLAANQWIARELHLGLELLASFVQPQATALTPVIQHASDLLEEATGRSALDGYQSDNPARVDAIVAALWDAMRAFDVRYAEPPANWGAQGQKIRTPQEVLEDRLGTCLDTTVTLAALLEQVGINSTLWLVDGHIFVGYWREDGDLGMPATTDIEDAINLAELGRISLLETTRVTGGVASASFGAASAAAQPYLEHRRTEILGITDVRGARENGILPLPSRTIGPDGEITVVEYRPAERFLAPFVADQRGSRDRTQTPPRVAQWKNSLLDLSLRNRLINFTDRAGHQLAVPGQALARLEDMINGGAGVTLLASDDVPQIARERGVRFGRDRAPDEREALLADKKQVHLSDITQAAYTTRLRALAAKAKTVTEETGANNLYLAFGSLRWEFNDRQLQSPLVLVPVTLESVSRGTSFRLLLDEAGASTPNYCLLEKLRVSFGIEIPGLADPETDAAGIDLHAAFSAVRQAMIDAKRPFVVDETVHLGILQFAKFRLWKDLDDNWEQLAENTLVSHLIGSPNEAFVDAVPAPVDVDLDALTSQVPVSADSSQLEAVVEAVAGRTFVLEGPPGTGKSQTITNLLARSLASGKRVLFVAEKRAALEVVKDRLDAVGLGAFSLDLHDKGARPNSVREQLRAALEVTVRPDVAALAAHREAVESSRGSLSRYAQRVHEPNSAGLSMYSARSQLLAAAADVPPLDVPASLVASGAPEEFEQLRSILRGLPAVSDLARPTATHAWGFVDEPATNASALHDAAGAFDRALAAVGADPLVARARNVGQLDAWAGVARAPRHPLDAVDRTQGDRSDQLAARIAEMAAQQPAWLTQVEARVLAHDVAAIHEAALAADSSSFFGRKKRRRAVLAQFASELRVEESAIRLRDLSTLTEEMAETAAQVKALSAELQGQPVVVVAPDFNPYLPADAQEARTALNWVGWLARNLVSDASPADDLRSELRRMYESTPADAAKSDALAALAAAWRALAAAAGTGTPNGSGNDRLDLWGGDSGVTSRWAQTRTARNIATTEPVTLGRWLDLLRHVEPLRRHGLEEARGAILSGRVRADDAALAFDKGVAAASLSEREDATALNDFDSTAHNRTITRFATSSTAIREELPRALPAEILSHRRFDPKYEGGDMGALKRQLSRQRGGDSVRALMEKYGDLITQITPCMLMSPESVARFFPARAGMFDVVVFDEASQIRVADAVGAMGRARSVVVVGDSKQMPPSTFAEVPADLDDIDSVAGLVADEESILTECTQARVPSKWLSWHYRSQDEALIAFSNHQYYESRLSSFPAPFREFTASAPEMHAGERPDYGVSLVRVDGRFERSGTRGTLRTNPVEARTIVDEVIRRFAASPDVAPSLGIITFNVQQRDLIENMLRDAPDERIGRALDERDGLFVKNLESVQGDERDTILFSVAFSKNDRGSLPLNFGPLSRAGGERRLNVAVTRARRQVILYASFDPAELRAEQTSARGLKDLRSYLELAARGVEPTADSTARVAVIDRHRDEIAAILTERGIVVKTDVGLSDFRVDLTLASRADPHQPLVAVLLDGEGWRARRTVADRDGLPVEVLGALMRWPGVERVWLPEWLDAPHATADRLVAAVERAASGTPPAFTSGIANAVPVEGLDLSGEPDEAPHQVAVERSNEADPEAVSVGIKHPNARPFVAWPAAARGGLSVLDALPSPSASRRVRAAIDEAVAAEGPISRARLAKLVAESFGLSRVSSARATSILRLVPPDFEREGDAQFLWPTGVDVSTWRDVRISTAGDSRTLESVALEEIANAMAVVAQLSGGVRAEEIKREALALFGGKRMTAQISDRLDQALALAVATGRVKVAESGAYLAAG